MSNDRGHRPSVSSASSPPPAPAAPGTPRTTQASLSPTIPSPAVGGGGGALTVPARRQRSVHIHVKPDPEPPATLGIALPLWMQGAASGGGGSSSSSSLAASNLTSARASSSSVPHRDFGMSPHRNSIAAGAGRGEPPPSRLRAASDPSTDSHTAALHNLRSYALRSTGSSGPRSGPSAPTRWTDLIRHQFDRIERDGLRSFFWGSGRQSGSGSINSPRPGNTVSTAGMFANAWDKLRRVPEILWVESEDPVGPSLLFKYAANVANVDYVAEDSSDDAPDLLDDSASDASPEKTRSPSLFLTSRAVKRAQTRRRNSRLFRVNRFLDRTRRMLGISRASLFLLLLLLAFGLWETLRSKSSSQALYENPLLLKVYPKDPFRTLAQARIPLPSSVLTLRTDAKLHSPLALTNQNPKTTAILLSWKRVDNLMIILAHLCAYAGTAFESVIVWNNNPDIRLTHKVNLAVDYGR